jgi:hypothetical protein
MQTFDWLTASRRSTRTSCRAAVCLAAIQFALPNPVCAQDVTTPLAHFGFEIGDDYHLATYTQFETYWHKLAEESPRMILEEIGTTAEGRTQLMAIVTSPRNHENLARYKSISRRLALAEGLTDQEARALAQEGRAVVWIDGGLHASEVLGAHQLIEMVYQMVSRNDEETLRFLDDVILLAVHANPDGMELVSNWYMREPVPEQRSTSGLPRLYHKYVGHDNNRDSYLVSQPETENMARILYREWMPQILYNHHQTGPAGSVLWAPPFRDPFNYNFDPLVVMGIEMVGNAMHQRFVAEGKPGAALRDGGPFSTWWNGGLRTTAYFHNIIGLLTETIGNPTPVEIPFIPDKQLPDLDMPLPIAPQEWHFRQSVEYSITADRAVMDYASRYRETLLYNIYLMGRNSVERGSRDHWTLHPTRLDSLKARLEEDGVKDTLADAIQGPLAGYFASGVPWEYYQLLRQPEQRDPRGYILPANQSDFPTASKFVNTLIKNGVTVHRATRDFTVAGRSYPRDSYVVLTAQAFRPHILDMFEPQDHPNDFAYAGGPPNPPYDNAGYTLAYQMGVEFDRILEGFEGPFEAVDGYAVTPPGQITNSQNATGFLLSHRPNDAAIAVNRLLASRSDVFWLSQETAIDGRTYPAGTIYIPATTGTSTALQTIAQDLGLSFVGVQSKPGGTALKLRPVRVGLWDEYGGSIPSGWTRWLMEQFEFPFEVVYPQTLDRGDLRSEFDVLVFVTGAIPAADRRGEQNLDEYFGGGIDPESIPDEFRGWLGNITVARTVPHLLEFTRQGGTILAIGSSTVIARHAGLPVVNHLVDERGRPLPWTEYYVPGSVLQVRVDNTRPIAFGLADRVDVFFNNSPVMRLLPAAYTAGVSPVAWFESDAPLRSGWAWGQHYLNGGVAIAEAQLGDGALYLFGPEILNRGQPHGTFKLLFNGIFLAGSEEVRLDLTN